jgi:hypothetical protein
MDGRERQRSERTTMPNGVSCDSAWISAREPDEGKRRRRPVDESGVPFVEVPEEVLEQGQRPVGGLGLAVRVVDAVG